MSSTIKLEKYLDEKRREEFRPDMLEAGQDPLFLADAEKCMRDFASIDKESWSFLGADDYLY